MGFECLRDALIETIEEKPEAAKNFAIAVAGGMLFALGLKNRFDIHKLGRRIDKIDISNEAFAKAVNHNADYSELTRAVLNNNTNTIVTRLELIENHLGIHEDCVKAATEASRSYLDGIGYTGETLVNSLNAIGTVAILEKG